MARVDAWLRLWALDAQPERGSLPVPCNASAPSAVARMREWAQTGCGQRCVSELRWRVLPRGGLLARVRGELGPLRGVSDVSLFSFVQQMGVPVALPERVPSWGPEMPQWDVVRSSLQAACTCLVRDPETWFCASCGGTHVPSAVAQNPDTHHAGRCPWCDSVADSVCEGCQRGVHFVGECPRWLLGASRSYAALSHGERWLCPDCMWGFVQALAAFSAPCTSPLAPVELANHMAEAARQVLPARARKPHLGQCSSGGLALRREGGYSTICGSGVQALNGTGGFV